MTFFSNTEIAFGRVWTHLVFTIQVVLFFNLNQYEEETFDIQSNTKVYA